MSRRVLIADDSAVARVSVARRVRAEGIEVEEQDARTFGPVFAKPGELDQAIDWIRRHR